MNNQARELRRYCPSHHFWSPPDSLGNSDDGKLVTLKAHGVGGVEKEEPAKVLANYEALKHGLENDPGLSREEKFNLISQVVAETRELKRCMILAASGCLPELEAGERLGTLLKRRREQLGYMVSEVALKLPISAGAYEQIESGYNPRPPDDVLKAVCDALGLNFEEVQKVANLDREQPVMGFGAGRASGFHFHGAFNLLPKAEGGSVHTLRQFFRMQREKLGYTAHEMAKKAGLSQSLYNAIESGTEKKPKREDLKKILLALGADASYLDTLPA